MQYIFRYSDQHFLANTSTLLSLNQMKLSSVSSRSTRFLKDHCRYYSKLYETMPRFLSLSGTIRNYLHVSRHLTDIVTWQVCTCDKIQACINICISISGSRKCERGELNTLDNSSLYSQNFYLRCGQRCPKAKTRNLLTKIDSSARCS